jgi:cysteine-rich repeat protein
MIKNSRFTSVFLAAIFTTFCAACVMAADEPQRMPETHPPAGQVCPHGSSVIGFDNESNILCSETCGNHVLNNSETCDDGNMTGGDGCSATCQSENPAAVQHEKKMAVEEPSTATARNAPTVAQPVISKIKPWKATWGVREVAVTITGMGFTNETTVRFNGITYKPSVNQAGTELKVTLASRQLPVGQYAITVSNGPEMESTVKKGLAIY